MTLDEIRSNAPDGATHYEIDDDGDVWYYKKCYHDCCWLDFDRDGNPSSSESPLLNEISLKPL